MMTTDLTAVISNQVTEIITETIHRFSQEFAAEEKDVQVYLGLDEEGENLYRICKNYQSIRKIGFTNNGILKPKIDFSGKSQFVPPVINQLLKATAAAHGIEENKVGVMLAKAWRKAEGEEEASEVIVPLLFDGTSLVKELTHEELFSKIEL